ncbi:MAG: iron ABC transporter substrate-binding protein [Arachnia propionica]|nr:MAG: iron ABC transporter substrate-binding protein [Arachnia propionica]
MQSSRFPLTVAALMAALLALSGCVGAPTETPESADATAEASAAATTETQEEAAGAFPVTITNCGVETTYEAAPKAAVTMNQGATEVMLALGLEDVMVGTAYLDDQISPRWEEAYKKVKVLSDEYPSKEEFLEAKADFAYASYSSAFTDKAIGTREELAGEKVNTYISPFYCPEDADKAEGDMEHAWAEIAEIGKIFGVSDRADKLIEEQKNELAKLTEAAAGKGKKVFWFDSGDKEPFAGAGEGGPQIIMDAVGATNIFADVPGNWETMSWEKVIEADPDVIVLAEASWSTAQSKIDYMENDPVLSKLKAVQAKAYVTLPFSETTPGVRLVDGADSLAEQIASI